MTTAYSSVVTNSKALAALRVIAQWLCACLSLTAFSISARASTFYVDFDSGSDQSDGQSMNHPWKHAPGDLAAQSNARRVKLQPGDEVKFKGGVVYRGAITLPASGAPGMPIRYLGNAWEPGRAIISGYDRFHATVESCKNNQECPNGFRTDRFSTIALPIVIGYEAKVKIDGEELSLAQSSSRPGAEGTPADIGTFFKILPGQVAKDGDWVSVTGPEVRESLGTDPGYDVTGFIWGMPNLIFYPESASYDAATGQLKLKAPHFTPYQNQGMYFAIANHPRLIEGQRQFATLDNGRRLLIRAGALKNNASIEISVRRIGFDFAAHSNIEVAGFQITGLIGRADEIKGGIAFINSSPASNIFIHDNNVYDTGSFAGSAVFSVGLVDGLSIKNNIISNHLIGRGISIYKGNNVVVEGNSISHLTFTGIISIGAHNVAIKRNILDDINGVHGNGITVYLNNVNVEIASNTITNSVRPITFKGDNSGAPINLVIDRNLIWIPGSGAHAAIQSWGARAGNIAIVSNVLLADDKGRGVELRKDDFGVVVANNILDGVNPAGIAADRLTVENNAFTRLGPEPNGAGNVIKPLLRDEALSLFAQPSSPSREICAIVNGFNRSEIFGINMRAGASFAAGANCVGAY